MSLEDLLYEIYNSGHYDKVMDLVPKIKAREPYKEIEEIYDIAYKMILDYEKNSGEKDNDKSK
tara:strand:+ start:177 stop:365 length:189 start_codon:yes stop_codon:yes gene_type:complete